MMKTQSIKLYLFLAIIAALVIFALLFPRLTLPFGFAYIIYLIVKPLTLRLTVGSKRQRFGYFILLIAGMVFLFFPVFATIYNIDTDFAQLTSRLPEVQAVLQDKFLFLKSKIYEKYGYKLNIDPVNFVMSKIAVLGTQFIAKFPGYISSLFEWVLLVPLFLYFLFKQSESFSRKFLEAVPNQIFEKSYVLFSQFNTKFGEYIIAKFIEATILGTIVTGGLLLIGFPYPFILGFFAGVTNILPYLGPIIGFVPAMLVALISQDSNISIGSMIIVYITANLIDVVFVFPLLVSKIVNLNPVLVVVSIVVGSQIGGIVGMIVIIPFIAFFKLLFREIYKDLSVNI